MDICILLNDHTLLNLEMQVGNKLNWEYRSVMYLCRSFDNLNHGQNYLSAKPAIHIGFLDYTLSEDHPEFYSINKLMNVKTHKIYSDNLTLGVVDLTRIDLATKEDRKYHIDDWAALFKATTWEEIKMLASKNEYMNDAAQTMYRMSAEEQIRKRCRDREEYYQDLQSYEQTIEEYKNALAQNRLIQAEKDAKIRQLQEEIDKLKQGQ